MTTCFHPHPKGWGIQHSTHDNLVERDLWRAVRAGRKPPAVAERADIFASRRPPPDVPGERPVRLGSAATRVQDVAGVAHADFLHRLTLVVVKSVPG